MCQGFGSSPESRISVPIPLVSEIANHCHLVMVGFAPSPPILIFPNFENPRYRQTKIKTKTVRLNSQPKLLKANPTTADCML